jgi:hypothetical protein
MKNKSKAQGTRDKVQDQGTRFKVQERHKAHGPSDRVIRAGTRKDQESRFKHQASRIKNQDLDEIIKSQVLKYNAAKNPLRRFL